MKDIPEWEAEYDADVARNSGQFASREKEDYMLDEIEALRDRVAELMAPAAPETGPVVLPRWLPRAVDVLPMRSSYTPAQALKMALNYAENLTDVIIVGQMMPLEGSDRQELFVCPSKMDIMRSLWIHRRLGFYIDENA